MPKLTITMRQIADAHPCDDTWSIKPLAALGKTEIDDTPVTFRQIVETSGIEDAIWCLRCLPEEDRWRAALLARSYAYHVVDLWPATDTAKEWLRTGDETLREKAAESAEAARAARAAEREWQAAELLRILSLEYSPEVMILGKKEDEHN